MNAIQWLFGNTGGVDLMGLMQVSVRALVIFLAAWLVFRIPGRRFLGKHAAFDALLGVILGATLSRSINGDAPVFDTLVAIIVMVGMHWFFAFLSYHFRLFRKILEGKAIPLIENGQIRWKHMNRNFLNETDLQGEMRSKVHMMEIDQLKEAFLEINGDIRFIPHGK